MQHLSSLPNSTQRLLEKLSCQSGLEGFTLIGGTALALQTGHRISEDIDLAWNGAKLPRARIQELLEELSPDAPGIDILDQVQKDLVTNDGFDLDDHHQDWSVQGVKVTFFAPDNDDERQLASFGVPGQFNKLAVASEDAIFRMKSRVILKRQTTRDYFDLWYLLEHKERKVAEILTEMRLADPHRTIDAHLSVLSKPKFKSGDPLWRTYLQDAPETPDELIARLSAKVEGHKVELAKKATLRAQQSQQFGL